MRGKEDAHDYRYFPEPDLMPLEISREWVEEIRAKMPELPEAKRQRYMSLGLSEYDASVLSADKHLSDYFEEVLKGVISSYIRIALDNKEFYLMLVSLFSSARDNEAFKAARPYISQLFLMLQEFFGRFANEQEGLRGKEEYCSISFTGIINTYMLVAFQRGTIDEVLENHEIIDFMVKQFLFTL